jgi:hypothetical protein
MHTGEMLEGGGGEGEPCVPPGNKKCRVANFRKYFERVAVPKSLRTPVLTYQNVYILAQILYFTDLGKLFLVRLKNFIRKYQSFN